MILLETAKIPEVQRVSVMNSATSQAHADEEDSTNYTLIDSVSYESFAEVMCQYDQKVKTDRATAHLSIYLFTNSVNSYSNSYSNGNRHHHHNRGN